MKSWAWLLSIATLVWSACASVERDEEAMRVRGVAEAFDSAMNAGDLQAMMALYAPDAARLDPGRPPRMGVASIGEDFAPLFAGGGIEVSNPVEELKVVGDWAFARGTFLGAATPPDVPGEVGKWVSVFRNTADGWKYAVDIWNLDAPPARRPFASRIDPPPLPEASVPEDIEATLDAWNAALVSGDVSALVETYTPESMRMSADKPIQVGLDAIRADFDEELHPPPEAAEAPVYGARVAADWAYVWGIWVETRRDDEGRGNWLEILRRTPDGWRIYIEIWNRVA